MQTRCIEEVYRYKRSIRLQGSKGNNAGPT